MSLILLFSHAWMRFRYYETFMFLHISLSIVTLVSLFVHTSIFEGQYDFYLWPVVVIWVLDRLLRLFRIVYFNFRARMSRDIVRCTETVATYNKQSDVMRLEIRPASSDVAPEPGQFYDIYQPGTLTGWENHPFTLGAWTGVSSGTTEVDSNEEEERKLSHSSSSSAFSETSCSSASSSYESLIHQRSSPEVSATRSLIFWVRPYDGWTKKLRNQCLKSSTKTIHPRLLLEGPYGQTHPLHSFDTVLLIAGGTGIASAVPYILSHITHANVHSPRTTKLHLVWTARQKSFIEDLCVSELAPALQREDFSAEFFTTRSHLDTEVSEVHDRHQHQEQHHEQDSSLQVAPVRYPEIRHERPNIRASILDMAAEYRQGRIAVLVCGPAGMADESRAAVVEAMKRGARGLEYFEEAFGW